MTGMRWNCEHARKNEGLPAIDGKQEEVCEMMVVGVIAESWKRVLEKVWYNYIFKEQQQSTSTKNSFNIVIQSH